MIKYLVKGTFREEGFIWLTDKGVAIMVEKLRLQEPEVADHITSTIRNGTVNVGRLLLNSLSAFCTILGPLPRE